MPEVARSADRGGRGGLVACEQRRDGLIARRALEREHACRRLRADQRRAGRGRWSGDRGSRRWRDRLELAVHEPEIYTRASRTGRVKSTR
jgi:hypothetical protein